MVLSEPEYLGGRHDYIGAVIGSASLYLVLVHYVSASARPADEPSHGERLVQDSVILCIDRTIGVEIVELGISACKKGDKCAGKHVCHICKSYAAVAELDLIPECRHVVSAGCLFRFVNFLNGLRSV